MRELPQHMVEDNIILDAGARGLANDAQLRRAFELWMRVERDCDRSIAAAQLALVGVERIVFEQVAQARHSAAGRPEPNTPERKKSHVIQRKKARRPKAFGRRRLHRPGMLASA